MADVPHLLENLGNHLVKGQLTYLPEETIKKRDLPTNCVNIEFIGDLVRHAEKDDIKLAPHFNASIIDPNHYDKTKVGPALSLSHNDTTGLRPLDEEQNIRKRTD